MSDPEDFGTKAIDAVNGRKRSAETAVDGPLPEDVRELVYFIWTVLILGFALPILVLPQVDLCFFDLNGFARFRHMKDLIAQGLVTKAEICTLDWLLSIYYICSIYGFYHFSDRVKDIIRSKAISKGVSKSDYRYGEIVFATIFIACAATTYFYLNSPSSPTANSGYHSFETKHFILFKTAIFPGVCVLGAAILVNLIRNSFRNEVE